MSYLLIYLLVYLNELTLSVCVCGDDHVTCYMGADVDAGERTEA